MNKSKLRAIAMRCNEEQFREIEPILADSNISISGLFDWRNDPVFYLINNMDDKLLSVTNVYKERKAFYNRTVFEEWDKKTFLEYCGIDVEPKFEITKEQILQLKDPIVKEWFPEAFKNELVVGEWYKRPHNKALFKVLSRPDETGKFEVYGFDVRGFWMESEKCHTFPNREVLATPKEVEEALIKEAKKRYKVGDYVCCLNGVNVDVRGNNFNYKDGVLYLSDSNAKYKVFENGFWASILPTMSLKEAEEKLNVKIV